MKCVPGVLCVTAGWWWQQSSNALVMALRGVVVVRQHFALLPTVLIVVSFEG